MELQKKAPKSRRSMYDMIEFMEPVKNTFFQWAYAGDRKTMCKLFPENAKGWISKSPTGTDYFETIPSHHFKNQSTIKTYGKNIQKLRFEKQITLEELSIAVHISFQQLHQIENGNRTKIHRNILLLFCGYFHTSPEALMGLELFPILPAMQFYEEGSAPKVRYIVLQLIFQNRELLELFIYLAQTPISFRLKLSQFLTSTPSLHMLSSERIRSLYQNPPTADPPNTSEGHNASMHLSEYLGKLSDATRGTPELLDAYISIAAQKKAWKIFQELTLSAGFIPFPPEEESV